MKKPTRAMRLTKAHKEQIDAIERAGYTVTPVRYSTGDHVILDVASAEGETRISIGGSPSCPHTGHALIERIRTNLRRTQQDGAA